MTSTSAQVTFNNASNVIHAIEALQDIKILNKGLDANGDLAIELNICGKTPDSHLTLSVSKGPFAYISDAGTAQGAPLSTFFGVKNRFAVNKTVKFVKRQAMKHGTI